MSSRVAAPQQHRQPSRKGKKAWRKNVDITEVQEGLETLREEILQGGPVAEKAAEELFSFDTKPSEEIKKKYNLKKPLKVDEILSRRSAIPAVDGRKRPQSALGDGILQPSAKKQKPDWVSKKEISRLRSSINDPSYLAMDKVDNDASVFDLWDTPAPLPQGDPEYVPQKRTKVMPSTVRRAPIPMTANARPVAAVQQPNGGTSYNPAFEDWDDLLNAEGSREVAAEQARLQKEREEAERNERVQAIANAPDENIADAESEWEGFETENDDPASLRKKRPQRKTPAQRNKALRRKEAEKLAKHEKRMGDKQKQAEQMITALIAAGEKTTDLEATAEFVEDIEAGDDRVLRRRKRGNTVIPEKAVEVVLPDELQDSLRRLKPEGNLLNDRFRNLLVNGKLEARKPVLQPKKRKVKMTEKWWSKDFALKV